MFQVEEMGSESPLTCLQVDLLSLSGCGLGGLGQVRASQGLVAEEGGGGSVYLSEDLVLSERCSLVGVKQVSACKELLVCSEGAPQKC